MTDREDNIKEYIEILSEPLEEIRMAFSEIVNKHADTSILVEAVRRLDNARQLINSTMNVGILVGIGGYIIIPYPLTGDPEKDMGQAPAKLPEE